MAGGYLAFLAVQHIRAAPTAKYVQLVESISIPEPSVHTPSEHSGKYDVKIDLQSRSPSARWAQYDGEPQTLLRIPSESTHSVDDAGINEKDSSPAPTSENHTDSKEPIPVIVEAPLDRAAAPATTDAGDNNDFQLIRSVSEVSYFIRHSKV